MENNFLSKYQQIKGFLLEELSSKRFKAGSKFYSNKEVAMMFKVSQITARKAFKSLEIEGYLKMRKGFGSVILEIPPTPRQLKVVEHKSIGILTGDIEMESNVALAKTFLILHRYLSSHGFMVSIAHKSEKQLIDAGVDGIIAIGFLSEKSISNLKKSKIPVVGWAYLKGVFPTVSLNYHKTALDVCNYFHKTGHKKIMFLGSGKDDVLVYKNFTAGIKAFLSTNNLSKIKISRKVRMKQDVYNELRNSLSQRGKRPDAIFLMSWLNIPLVMQAINDENLKIPDDISIIVHGINALSANTVPRLTSVHWDLNDFCEQTGKIILQLIRNKENEVADYIIDTHIDETESCAPRNN